MDRIDYDNESEEEAPRDPKTDEAKQVLELFFDAYPQGVFYESQIEVFLEIKFFHWITTRALGELVPLTDQTPIRFFWARTKRYWRREASAVAALVREFSALGRAFGDHGEMLIDAGLAGAGFIPTAKNVRTFRGREWNKTRHTLDRIYERDGVAYGSEIKNSLGYIEKEEFHRKLEMCRLFKVRPLFIMRSTPKSYMHEIIYRQRGYGLLFGRQLYPFGQEELARRVRAELGLPVHCPRSFPDGFVQKFLGWHRRQRGVAEEG